MNEKEELLEPETVARILDCTPEEVIQLARSGELKATKMGKHWKFRRADVTAFKGHQEQSE
jgi:excisionase family DNA binding protein